MLFLLELGQVHFHGLRHHSSRRAEIWIIGLTSTSSPFQIFDLRLRIITKDFQAFGLRLKFSPASLSW